MRRDMRSSLILAVHLLLLILFHEIVENNTWQVFARDEGEANALSNLKHAFNNTVLNRQWEGPICSSDGTYNSSWFGIECTNGRVSGISLPSLGLSGSIDNSDLSSLTELTVLNLTNNSIHGSIMNFTTSAKLRSIDLSCNKFEGPISSSLLFLDSLMSLHLEENNLTGEVLDFNQVSLRDLNVSYNNLSGTIPTTAVIQSFDKSSFIGNPNLCGPPLSPCEKNKKNFTLFSRSSLIIVFILFDVIAVVLIATCCFIYKKRRNLEKRERKKRADHVEQEVLGMKKNVVEDVVDKGSESVDQTSKEMPKLTFFRKGDDRLEFELDQLLRASADSLGKGNFGSCYKAKLPGGPAVVVKRLKDVSPLTDEEFGKHMKFLGDLTHPNLLPFIAYYYSNEEKLLVHKVAPHTNLFFRLHVGRGTSERVALKWSVRLSIAKGVARAMAYLHLNAANNIVSTNSTNSCCSYVPHGNLKPSNVLLDDKDEALVTDHALSSIVSPTIASQRMGAYKSPEYLHRRKVSPKSDVWCFGSLLLEILTGRVSTVSNATNGVDLGGWVYRAVREEWTAEIFDVEIAERKRASGGMLELLKVALRCCEKQPEKRPEMVEVARAVEEIVGDGVEAEAMSDESWSSFGTAEDELASMSLSDH